jgi:phospholipase C
MFPHTVTIFHHSVVGGSDVYERVVLTGCYWNHKASQTGSGKGTEKTDSFTVVFSPEQTANYGNTWKVYAGDRVVKGSVPDITSWRELTGDVMTVKVIEENICGSCVDNITLIG